LIRVNFVLENPEILDLKAKFPAQRNERGLGHFEFLCEDREGAAGGGAANMGKIRGARSNSRKGMNAHEYRALYRGVAGWRSQMR
jgi:hypothetical protein